MTTTEVLMVIWYASGCTLAYGLFMGHYMVNFAPILGVRNKDVRAACIFSCLSWFAFLFEMAIGLIVHKKLVFCWNMSRMYPLDPHPKWKQIYIEKHGEIK